MKLNHTPESNLLKQQKKVFHKLDSNLRKNREKLIEFAKAQGYKSYSEYLHKEYDKLTAKELQQKLKEFGIHNPPSQNSIWILNSKIQIELEEYRYSDICAENTRGLCKRCHKKPIPPGNWKYCVSCQNDNKRISNEFEHINSFR